MKIVLFLLAAFIILISIVIIRALMLKPTSAKEAVVTLDTTERSIEYGKKLARMVRKETISSRFDPDRTKFLEFHEILEELFPSVHKTC